MTANRWIVLPIVLLVVLPVRPPSNAQTKQEIRQQAETQLQQMTPEEIDRKIKELGLTREEADRKAAELGISLEKYLSAAKPTAPAPVVKIEPVAQPVAAASDTTAKPTPAKVPTGPGGLPYFGYDVFSAPTAAFEPSPSGPVDPEYVIGPGDVLRVSVWGQVEFQNELTVDREGRIFINTVGQVLVSGMTLDEAYNKLLRTMSRSYAGLVAKNPTIWMDLTIAKLRPKRVFLMGEVANPGGYTVSSYATVFNSLYAVGGPTVRGSMREVRVVRGDRVITKVDLYDYLLGADKTNDIRVQNNDIIYVPVRGKTVAVRGSVQRPAIYELKEGESLVDLVRFAGGLLPTAFVPNAQIERIKPVSERTGTPDDRIVLDVDLREVLKKGGRAVNLDDADTLQVFPILDEKYNYVTVTGSVWRPGRYELSTIRTVRDLVQKARGLQPKTYMTLAHLIRYNDDLITTRIIPFNLDSALTNDRYNRMLMPRDEVIIYSTEMIDVKDRYVTINGEVKKPGRYALRDNMTLEDLIPLAGGYTEAAEALVAEVSRVSRVGLTGDSLAILLHPNLPSRFEPPASSYQDTIPRSDLLAQGRFLLRHRDEVLVRPNPNYRTQNDITIEGEIMYPGVYAIQYRGETLAELLHRAGGPTAISYLGGAQLMRGGKRLLVDFDRAYYDRDEMHNIQMKAGDRIIIPPKPHTVFVTGEVNMPGLLSYIRGDDVSDYVDRAGGLTDSASYAVLMSPTGESRRVNFGWFSSDPRVLEGSTIEVKKIPPPQPSPPGETVAQTVTNILAIMTSAATIAFIVWEVTK